DVHPWETCMTLNGHWGYHKMDDHWKSTQTLVRNLIDVVSKGGNFLLNVGPTGEGLIPAPSVERLREVGAWMKVNGQAMYGTTASPLPVPDWGRYTQRSTPDGTTLYLHVFKWPANGKLVAPGLRAKVSSVTLVAGGRELSSAAESEGLMIRVPERAPDEMSS